MLQFTFLVPRLCAGVIENIPQESLPACDAKLQEIAAAIYNSASFQKMSAECKLLYKEWLQFELRIDPSQDIFVTDYERMAYYDNMLQSFYMASSVEEGGCNGCYITACRIVALELLRYSRDYPDISREHIDIGSSSRRCGQQQIDGDSVSACVPSSKESQTLESDAAIVTSRTPCRCCRLPGNHHHRGNSRLYLQQFLQSLCMFIPPQTDTDGTDCKLWLHDVFHEHLKATELQYPDSTVYLHSSVKDFISLALALPPYLFFHNHPQDELTSANISAAVELTNSYLRNYLCQSLALPELVLIYILQALHGIGKSEQSEVYVKYFLKVCVFYNRNSHQS